MFVMLGALGLVLFCFFVRIKHNLVWSHFTPSCFKCRFSFADYHSPKYNNFGALRVINEDRVEAEEGFGTHSHSQYEIWSYVVSGELTHRDSMGNTETIKRGDVQFTSAGTGISHSEFNHSKQKKQVHFLQIWATPDRVDKPAYQTAHFGDEQKRNQLCPIVTPEIVKSAEFAKTLKIRTDLWMFASILDNGKELNYQFESPKSRRGYLQVVSTKSNSSLTLNGSLLLEEGDGAFIDNLDTLKITGTSKNPTEFLFFDLAKK